MDQNGATIGQVMTTANREFAEKAVAERAKSLELGYADLTAIPVNPDALGTISREKAVEARTVVFFRIGKKIRVAFDDPQSDAKNDLLETLRRDGYAVNQNLVSIESINHALSLYETLHEAKKPELTAESVGTLASVEVEVASISDLPVAMAKMQGDQALLALHKAVLRTEASDLHIEPIEKGASIRVRIDGVMQPLFEVTTDVFGLLLRQIKYEAKMKLNLTRIAQDGQYFFRIGKRQIDVRVSVLPTPSGESIVMRFLDSTRAVASVADLGFSVAQRQLLATALTRPTGMAIVTGPTGSGKTTTLAALLSALLTPQIKAVTLEDPIEYRISGAVQSQISEGDGFSFADALRSVLRHDPDLILLGEMRDTPSAQTAAQAALTGHRVLSTLHTNSALEAPARLLAMGVPSFVLAPALSVVIAQRLVRKLCPHCARAHAFTEVENRAFDAAGVSAILDGREPVGCPECSGTGFLGRTTVAEILVVSPEIRAAIETGATTSAIEAIAKTQGFEPMRVDALKKVAASETSFAEVMRAV